MQVRALQGDAGLVLCGAGGGGCSGAGTDAAEERPPHAFYDRQLHVHVERCAFYAGNWIIRILFPACLALLILALCFIMMVNYYYFFKFGIIQRTVL